MKKIVNLSLLVILSVAVIAYVDTVVRPGYLLKTMVKAPIFLFVPIIFSRIYKEFLVFDLLKTSKKGLKQGFLLGLGIYFIIVIAYLIANSLFDLSTIKESLENNLGINKSNFIMIGLYVSLINSFLEEWFFRGFVFSNIKNYSRLLAYVISSLAFSIYHIAIMDGMFNILLLSLVLIGLFIGGLIFNYLNEKNENIYSSWLCHIFANLAMNTVGFMIFFL